jgi:hypothetical protein
MKRFSTVLMVLVAAGFATGCRTHYQQHAISAERGLDKIIARWQSHSSGLYGEETYYANYLVSDVHYGMASPLAPPVTTAETSAVVVKPFTSLNVIEFGDINTPTSTGNSTSSGVGRESWAGQFGPNKMTAVNTNAVNQSIAAIRDAGNDIFLGWGRWTDSRFISAGVEVPGCCSENKSAHYVFGAATPNDNIPNTGFVATFNLLGATAPTISDGSSAPGTLTSGTVAVSFNGATANTRMGVNLAGTLNNLPFTVQSPGTTLTPTIPYDPVTRSFTMTNSIVDGSSISGFLAGPTASHVGLTYATPRQVGGSTFQIQGAAAFIR